MTSSENPLSDDQMQTVGAGGTTGSTGGDADATDSNTTQVDPRGVDPAGGDADATDAGGGGRGGGDADATDSDSVQVDPAGVDPAGGDASGVGSS